MEKPRFAAMPPDVRWRLRPTGDSTQTISGLRPLTVWGVAPDSINSSRKGTAGTALPHLGRHSRERVSTDLDRARFCNRKTPISSYTGPFSESRQ